MGNGMLETDDSPLIAVSEPVVLKTLVLPVLDLKGPRSLRSEALMQPVGGANVSHSYLCGNRASYGLCSL